MDVCRFPPRQDAESGNPLERLSSELLPPRGKAAFFGYFLCGGKESDPAAQRSEALFFSSKSKQRRTRSSYNHPFCRASRYASIRLPTPSLPIASDR